MLSFTHHLGNVHLAPSCALIARDAPIVAQCTLVVLAIAPFANQARTPCVYDLYQQVVALAQHCQPCRVDTRLCARVFEQALAFRIERQYCLPIRTEESRVGKEGVSTCEYRR